MTFLHVVEVFSLDLLMLLLLLLLLLKKKMLFLSVDGFDSMDLLLSSNFFDV